MSVINGNSPELIVKNGLILNLDAGNRKSYISGSNTMYDLSGNNHTGSLINGPTFSSSNGGNIVFDASDDYVEISSSLSSVIVTDTPGYTITGWFNASVNDGNWRTIITKESTGGSNRQYYIGLNGGYAGTAGSLSFFSNQGGQGGVSTTTTIQTNTWYYFAATHYGIDGNNANTLYVRTLGQELAFGSPFDPTSTNGAINEDIGTNPIRIGKYTDGNPFLWNGKIANITYYNRKLSQSEILQNYNANKSRFATSSLSISNVPKVPTNGLVFEIDAANPKSYVSGSTNIYDISPTNLSGSLINGVGYSSTNKGSLTFDGGNDYVQVSDNPIFNFGSSNFTLNVTAKIIATQASAIFSQPAFDGFAPLLMYSGGGGNISFYISSNGTSWDLFSGGLIISVASNQWYDITLTRNGNVWTTYKNGQYVTSATVAGTLYDSSENVKIGARTGLYPNYTSGSISSVRIYNRALSASEVRSMYDATKGRYGL